MKERLCVLLMALAIPGFFTASSRAESQDYWYKESAWVMQTGTASQATLLYANWLSQGPSNTLYVTDHQTRMLYRYTESGDFVHRVQNDLFDDITGFETDSSGNLWMLTSSAGNGDLLLYNPTFTVTNRITLTNLVTRNPVGLGINSRSEVFLAEGTSVFGYRYSGSFPTNLIPLRSWSVLNAVRRVAIGPNDDVYVLDYSSISIYDRLGTFVRRFDVPGDSSRLMVGQDGTVYVWYANSLWMHIYDSRGKLLRRWYEYTLPGGEVSVYWYQGMLVKPDGRLLAVVLESPNNRSSWLVTYRRSGYAFQSATPSAMPLPRVDAISQRSGAPIIDVDYAVYDHDNSTVNTAVYALKSDTASLNNFYPVRSLIEGTHTNIGPNTATGRVFRLTWNAGADITTNVIDVAVRIAARDSSEMLAFDFITIPNNGVDPEFTINRVPVLQHDLLPLWFWLLAKEDPDLVLTAGEVRGSASAAGDYRTQRLAYGAYTTPLGAQYLFDRMGLRPATTNELRRAREGASPGTVNQYTPRVTVEQYPSLVEHLDRPSKINEYGFDTDTANWDYWYNPTGDIDYWFPVKKQ